MEEKKVVHVGAIGVLLIIAIIVVAIEGFIICKINSEKTAKEQEITNLQQRINALNTTINQMNSSNQSQESDTINDNNNASISSGLDIMRGHMLSTETKEIFYFNDRQYFYVLTDNSTDLKFKKVEIKGLEGKNIKKAIYFQGPQIIYSSTLVLLCDDGLYFANWENVEDIETSKDPAVTDTVYARKVETRSNNIAGILQTSYDTGDITKGYENYVVVIYDDGTFEEIFVLNDRMAS